MTIRYFSDTRPLVRNNDKMMIKNFVNLFGLFCYILMFISCGKSEEYKLFNGESLEGWEGDERIFRISDNSILGGNSKDSIDYNYHLCTKQKFKNFDLTLEVKIYTGGVHSNSGVCFRSYRTEDGLEVVGYQADIGYMPLWWLPLFSNHDTTNLPNPYPLWGCLIDENRKDSTLYPNPKIYPVVFLGLADHELVEQHVIPNDWNEMRIIAIDEDIEIRINGKSILKFREDRIENSAGSICLQVHSGGPLEVGFRNIRIKEIKS